MTARRVKIVRMVTSLRVSGPSLQAILLSAYFQRDSYETILVVGDTPQDADNMLDVASRYGVKPLIVPQLRRTLNPVRGYQALRTLYRLFREVQPDILHTHMTTAGFWGRLAARLAGVPVLVHTLHEHPFKGYYKPLQTQMFVALERLTARYTDSIITLSERLRRELADEYHITRRSAVTVLPLGFDLSSFAATPRRQGRFRQLMGIPADVPLVGIVGRLIPVKNHELFLQAAATITQAMPQARFVIVGDGDERETLEQRSAQLGLAQQVLFAGWQQNMPDIYSDLDVLAITSHNEGTPVPIIEALSAGCPVVATDVGGVADLLDNGAFGTLIPSGDSTALVNAIVALLQAPPDLGPARQAMMSRYSIERLVLDLGSLYRGLLIGRK
jgi:glycosyltransferase involved in cell wall biosynthesis